MISTSSVDVTVALPAVVFFEGKKGDAFALALSNAVQDVLGSVELGGHGVPVLVAADEVGGAAGNGLVQVGGVALGHAVVVANGGHEVLAGGVQRAVVLVEVGVVLGRGLDDVDDAHVVHVAVGALDENAHEYDALPSSLEGLLVLGKTADRGHHIGVPESRLGHGDGVGVGVRRVELECLLVEGLEERAVRVDVMASLPEQVGEVLVRAPLGRHAQGGIAGDNLAAFLARVGAEGVRKLPGLRLSSEGDVGRRDSGALEEWVLAHDDLHAGNVNRPPSTGTKALVQRGFKPNCVGRVLHHERMLKLHAVGDGVTEGAEYEDLRT
ncbi:aldo/keto reductase [Babesia caballi]|uniref:Aldo/keto reductase n=1 Tax=Babesia caballi TaxID=5871 RepID=A0AAV4LV96_BABCB|nr:aldo/keto reductase [Babesia caballi]